MIYRLTQNRLGSCWKYQISSTFFIISNQEIVSIEQLKLHEQKMKLKKKKSFKSEKKGHNCNFTVVFIVGRSVKADFVQNLIRQNKANNYLLSLVVYKLKLVSIG